MKKILMLSTLGLVIIPSGLTISCYYVGNIIVHKSWLSVQIAKLYISQNIEKINEEYILSGINEIYPFIPLEDQKV